jgi:hypothetical protein
VRAFGASWTPALFVLCSMVRLQVENSSIILARVVEQLSAIQQRLGMIEEEMKFALSHTTEIAVMRSKVEMQATEISQLRERLTRDYVKQESFRPLQRVVYGAIALMLTSVGTLLLSLLKMAH